MSKLTRNPKFKPVYQRAGLCKSLSGSPSAPARDIKLAKKSTVPIYGAIFQIRDENNQQRYCFEEFEYLPKPRYDKRKKRMHQPPAIKVRLQYPLGRPYTHVMVENVITGRAFSAPVERLGLKWVDVTPGK